MKSWLWQIICVIGTLGNTQLEIFRKAYGWSTRMAGDVYRTGSKTWWRLNRMGKQMVIHQLLPYNEGRRPELLPWWVCCSCQQFYRSCCAATLEVAWFCRIADMNDGNLLSVEGGGWPYLEPSKIYRSHAVPDQKPWGPREVNDAFERGKDTVSNTD